MSVIVKHRTDLDTVASPRRRQARPGGRCHRRLSPAGTAIPGAARGPAVRRALLAFAEDLREEGVALGTSEILDAFAALGTSPGQTRRTSRRPSRRRSPSPRRTGGCSSWCSTASSSAPPRRRRPAARISEGRRPRRRRRGEINLETLRQQIAAALRDGSDGAMRDLARLAIAAFGEGEGSGVLGVDVQRIRRALGLRAEPQPDLPEDDPRRHGPPASSSAASSRTCGASSSATLIERDGVAPAQAAAQRARPRAAHRSDPGPGRRPPGGRAAQAPARDPGPRAEGPQAPRARRRAAHDARLARDRRRPDHAQVPPAAPAPPRDLRPVRRLDERDERDARSSSASCTPSTTRFASSARSCSSSGSPRSPRCSSASATSAPRARPSRATPASPTSPATPTTAGCGTEFLAMIEDELHPRATVIVLGDARTNGRPPRDDVFAAITARAGRTFWLNPEPRLYWNYGDCVIAVIREALHRVRVLAYRPARGVRQGADVAARLRVRLLGLGCPLRPARRSRLGRGRRSGGLPHRQQVRYSSPGGAHHERQRRSPSRLAYAETIRPRRTRSRSFACRRWRRSTPTPRDMSRVAAR